MKKRLICCLLAVGIMVNCKNCFAQSIWNTKSKEVRNMSDGILEEITPNKSNRGQLIGVDITLTIPADYEGEEIIFTPNMFYSIGEYKYIMPGDRIKVNLKVVNNSKYNYNYVDNSFVLETDDIKRLGTSDNFTDTLGVGYDGRKIYDIFSPYRTFNTALKALYNDTFKNSSLDEKTLDTKLKNKGYSGINELDKYYLNFYNNKYNLKNTSLDQFTYSVIKEMLDSSISDYKETNPRVIELSYNFFYNKLLSYNFSDEEVNDSNSQDYSIGSYMRSNLGNSYFKDSFNKVLSNNTYELNNMSLNINGNYTVNVYMYYNFSGYMEFRLKKVNINNDKDIETDTNQRVIGYDNDLIVPPNTGI